MKEAIGVVEDGRIKLPPSIHLPDGAKVRVTWEEPASTRPPIEREPLSEEQVASDIQWATGKRFPE